MLLRRRATAARRGRRRRAGARRARRAAALRARCTTCSSPRCPTARPGPAGAGDDLAATCPASRSPSTTTTRLPRLGGLADVFLTPRPGDRGAVRGLRRRRGRRRRSGPDPPFPRLRPAARRPLPVGPSGDAPARGRWCSRGRRAEEHRRSRARGPGAWCRPTSATWSRLASRDAHQRVTDQLLGFHRSRPELLVADLHPGYASRAWARSTRRRSAYRCWRCSTTTPTSPPSRPSTVVSTSRCSGWSSTAPATAATPRSGAASCCCSATPAAPPSGSGTSARAAPRRRRRGAQPRPHGRARPPAPPACRWDRAAPVAERCPRSRRASSPGRTPPVGLRRHQQRRTALRRGRLPAGRPAPGHLRGPGRRSSWRPRPAPGGVPHGAAGSSEPLPFPVATGPTGLPVLDPAPLVRALVDVVRRGRPGRGRWPGPSTRRWPRASAELAARRRRADRRRRTVGLSAGSSSTGSCSRPR